MLLSDLKVCHIRVSLKAIVTLTHICFTLNLDQENAGSILYKMLSGFNFFCVSDGFLIRNYHLIEQMNQSNMR